MNEDRVAAWWQNGWERAWIEPGSLSRIGKTRRIWRGLERAMDRRMRVRAEIADVPAVAAEALRDNFWSLT